MTITISEAAVTKIKAVAEAADNMKSILEDVSKHSFDMEEDVGELIFEILEGHPEAESWYERVNKMTAKLKLVDEILIANHTEEVKDSIMDCDGAEVVAIMDWAAVGIMKP